MSMRPRWNHRAVALLAGLGLVATLAACDSGGSSKSDADATTTTRARHRRGSTSTSSSTSATTTTPDATGTTAPPATPPASTTPPPATAACGVQLPRISAAITDGGLQAVPVDDYTIGECRLAPSQPTWSAVVLTPKPGQTVPRLNVVVERIGSIWTVHSYGPGATGCDAPAPVPAELGLGCS
jgi:hypothetical protein